MRACPAPAANPLLAELTAHKPKLKVLNKQDVADPERTALWLDWYNASETRAVPLDASDPAPARKLIDACHLLAPNRGGMAKPMRVLICGVPNVGESGSINTLSDERQAKTGDKGITKLEQRITLANRLPVGHPRHALAPHHRARKRLQPGRQRCRGAQCLR